jgi:hypothetical protein
MVSGLIVVFSISYHRNSRSITPRDLLRNFVRSGLDVRDGVNRVEGVANRGSARVKSGSSAVATCDHN